MTTLHTVNQSWHTRHWIYEQIVFASKGDAILLIEDAVLAIDSTTTLASFVAKCKAMEVRVYAQQEDSIARGLSTPIDGIELIDVNGFVALLAQHHKHCAW